jgi:ribonuclease HII
MTVAQLRVIVDCEQPLDDHLLAHLERDERSGVRKLVGRHERRLQALETRRQRARDLRALDDAYWQSNIELLAGVDEVGRGCIAGPVVAAAVILPRDFELEELDDSKKLTRSQRQECSDLVHRRATAVGFGCVEADQIDRLNILQASLLAMRLAVRKLGTEPQRVLVDGNMLPGSGFPEEAVVHGDSRSISIAAASVVAKVHRDAIMERHAHAYPQYGFAEHRGYGTEAHLGALEKHGPMVLHRRSFAPVADCFSSDRAGRVQHLSSCLKNSTSLEELSEVAAEIKNISTEMSDDELEVLRQEYRKRARALGRPGARCEELTAQFLTSKGYAVESRNYRGAGGEIDLVVRRGKEVVFVEVKSGSKSSLGKPEDRVRHQKRRHLVRAAQHYIQRAATGSEFRFDVVAIIGGPEDPEITHFENAFQAR